MNYNEVYHFDLSGYLLVRSLLENDEVDALAKAVDELEPYFMELSKRETNRTSQYKQNYYFDKKSGASIYSYHNPGTQIVVEDCIGTATAFDRLIGHPKIMAYVSDMVLPPHAMTGSEIRYRYKDNTTSSHMGGPIDVRNRYHWVGTAMKVSDGSELPTQPRFIDLINLRMMIALHDIGADNGPFCLVPGSHKANLLSPFGNNPYNEPGMHAVTMQKGDILFFTENMRHGGYTNKSDRPRKSIHLMYSQNWARTQSQVHFNTSVRIHRSAWNRYSAAQKAYFPDAEIID